MIGPFINNHLLVKKSDEIIMYLKLYYNVNVSAEYERKVIKISLESLAYMLFCSIFLFTQIILDYTTKNNNRLCKCYFFEFLNIYNCLNIHSSISTLLIIL